MYSLSRCPRLAAARDGASGELRGLSPNEFTLLFAEVFSLDRAERIRQVRELAAEFVKKRVAGVIYEPLAEPNVKEANEHILRVFKRAGIPVVLIDCDIFLPAPLVVRGSTERGVVK